MNNSHHIRSIHRIHSSHPHNKYHRNHCNDNNRRHTLVAEKVEPVWREFFS